MPISDQVPELMQHQSASSPILLLAGTATTALAVSCPPGSAT